MHICLLETNYCLHIQLFKLCFIIVMKLKLSINKYKLWIHFIIYLLQLFSWVGQVIQAEVF